MVVVICAIAILYMMAERRLNDLPAAAERANFQAVLEQMKTGVTLAMAARVARGGAAEVQELAGTNPMDNMLEGPSNYLGELEVVDDSVRRRNAWYFEKTSGELVYVVGGNSIADVWVSIAALPVNLGQIRFKVENLFDDGQGGVIPGSKLLEGQPIGRWEAVQLVPTNAYRWDQREDSAINELVDAGNS
jgi:hypothetical protein